MLTRDKQMEIERDVAVMPVGPGKRAANGLPTATTATPAACSFISPSKTEGNPAPPQRKTAGKIQPGGPAWASTAGGSTHPEHSGLLGGTLGTHALPGTPQAARAAAAPLCRQMCLQEGAVLVPQMTALV